MMMLSNIVPDDGRLVPAAVTMVRRMAMRDRRGGSGQHESVIMLHFPLRKGRPASAALKAGYS
jgi:hypothetical protein